MIVSFFILSIQKYQFGSILDVPDTFMDKYQSSVHLKTKQLNFIFKKLKPTHKKNTIILFSTGLLTFIIMQCMQFKVSAVSLSLSARLISILLLN